MILREYSGEYNQVYNLFIDIYNIRLSVFDRCNFLIGFVFNNT